MLIAKRIQTSQREISSIPISFDSVQAKIREVADQYSTFSNILKDTNLAYYVNLSSLGLTGD